MCQSLEVPEILKVASCVEVGPGWRQGSGFKVQGLGLGVNDSRVSTTWGLGFRMLQGYSKGFGLGVRG